MTVRDTITAIANQLATIASPQIPAAIYADPQEQFSLAQFPCLVLAEAPGLTHTCTPRTFGQGAQLWLHQYTIVCYVMLGARNTPLNALHQAVMGWPEALMTAIGSDLTEGGLKSLGQDTSEVISYKIGPIAWGDQEFWGVTALFPVTDYFQA
jgi:hypothetical protein